MRLVRSSRFWALLDDVRVALPACVHRHRVSIGSAQVVTDPGLRSLQQTFTLLPSYKTNDDNIFWQHKTLDMSGGLFADFVKNGSAELGFMRPRNECTELFAEHTYSPEHTYSECLSSCSSPVQPIHPEQGLHPSARIDGRHELRCYSTVAHRRSEAISCFLLGLIAKAVHTVYVQRRPAAVIWILTNCWRN